MDMEVARDLEVGLGMEVEKGLKRKINKVHGNNIR
jgi:hypothetical protein